MNQFIANLIFFFIFLKNLIKIYIFYATLRLAILSCRKSKYLFMKNKKQIYFLLIISVSILFNSCNTRVGSWFDAITGASITNYPQGNSFFHESDVEELKSGDLYIDGEVKNPGKVNFRKLYKREVVVKEATIINDEVEFIGAFRYIGYSLFDILHPYVVAKKNNDEFPPHVDLYIEVKNDKNESVVFSWSEIFHVLNPHQIILATDYAPIVPGKKEVNYNPGESWKIVAANDFMALRNIENPTSITVYSFDRKEYKIDRDIKVNESEDLSVLIENFKHYRIADFSDFQTLTYPSVSYGMGMGYRKQDNYSGYTLQSILNDSINLKDANWIKNGLVCFVSVDGYRAIYSFSELFNRHDMVSKILSVVELEDGLINYRNYIPTDFFIDRSVKSLQELYVFKFD